MRLFLRLALIAVVLVAGASLLRAQDSAAATGSVGPCRDYPCKLLVDWGAGNTAASYPNDRRYGQATDFEPKLKLVMQEAGLRIVDGGDVMVMNVRPVMKNAMCDAMPGTNTDMSCRTVDVAQVQFNSPVPSVKAPSAMRITNRCGAGEQRMTVAQMATYAGSLIAYQLATDHTGMKRPTMKC